MIYVLVDIDETMVSVPEGINAKSSRVMFREIFGIDSNEEEINNVGKTEKGIIQEVLAKEGKTNVEIPKEAYKIWADALDHDLSTQPVKILPGMPEFLESLSKDPRVNLILLTGNSPWRAEVKLKSAGFDKYFRDPKTEKLKGVFGDATPKRDELFTILKKMTGPQDKFAVVDDSIIGAKMAKENNLLMIAVLTGKAKKKDLNDFTPNIFPDFGEERWKKAIDLILALS